MIAGHPGGRARHGRLAGHRAPPSHADSLTAVAITIGYVRQLDRLLSETLDLAGRDQPGRGRLVMDVDSFKKVTTADRSSLAG